MLKWYEESGNNNDVVISSRIRLARNLSKYPFSAKLSPYAAKDMVLELKEKLSDFMKKDEREYEYISLEQLTDVEKVGLVERNVLSEALISKEGTTAAIISKDGAVSIMLNEEDHIRIQALVGGMNFEKAFSIADKIDDNINVQFQYAFDERMGFLTSFLTNIGTGLRASYLLHLPAMASTRRLTGIAADIGRFGVTIRGMNSGGNVGVGNMYQIYNQKTLGQSEADIIAGLNSIVNQIIGQERKLRKRMLDDKSVSTADKFYRSYGILKYSKKLDITEAMNLLSDVQLGISMGIINVEDSGIPCIYSIMMGIQPANLEKNSGKHFDKEERMAYRAEYVKNHLPEIIS
ncbi:MAG: protein arginine kinase [Clostridiales bacterium]|nr:protein arginine kinase [Clostridiales bacterium]